MVLPKKTRGMIGFILFLLTLVASFVLTQMVANAQKEGDVQSPSNAAPN